MQHGTQKKLQYWLNHSRHVINYFGNYPPTQDGGNYAKCNTKIVQPWDHFYKTFCTILTIKQQYLLITAEFKLCGYLTNLL